MTQSRSASVAAIPSSADGRPVPFWLQVAFGGIPIGAALCGVLLVRLSLGEYPRSFGWRHQ